MKKPRGVCNQGRDCHLTFDDPNSPTSKCRYLKLTLCVPPEEIQAAESSSCAEVIAEAPEVILSAEEKTENKCSNNRKKVVI